MGIRGGTLGKSFLGSGDNEAARSKLGRIGAKLRGIQPVFVLESFAAVRLAIHPRNKLQGIPAKTNKGFTSTELLVSTALSAVVLP